jgi:type III secretion protein R
LRPRPAAWAAGLAAFFWAAGALAQEAAAEPARGGFSLDWLVAVAALAALPVALAMLTAFVKVVVVLGILKSALGLQSVPALPLVIGLAIVLTAVVMAPVAEAVVERAGDALEELAEQGRPPSDFERATVAAGAALGPLVEFLRAHAHESEVRLFARLTERAPETAADDPLVLAPAFVVSELKEAFMLGFLLFVPFLVLDLVVANVLLSLGMHMLSPTTVSLPFKLLLFVLVDGWHLLAGGLIASYQLA